MAVTLNLITKAAGVVTPSVDGALAAAILPDCALTGCEVTASGAKVYVAPGYINCGGRIVQIDAQKTISLTASKRLVVRVTATAATIETLTAGKAITTDDLNMGGTTHEAILADVSYSDGVATITRAMPKFCRNGGILVGTTAEPPAGNYADGTLYLQV